MPWLKLSQNITYAHHDLEIIGVIRYTAKSSNIEAHMLLYDRFVLKYFDNCKQFLFKSSVWEFIRLKIQTWTKVG